MLRTDIDCFMRAPSVLVLTDDTGRITEVEGLSADEVREIGDAAAHADDEAALVSALSSRLGEALVQDVQTHVVPWVWKPASPGARVAPRLLVAGNGALARVLARLLSTSFDVEALELYTEPDPQRAEAERSGAPLNLVAGEAQRWAARAHAQMSEGLEHADVAILVPENLPLWAIADLKLRADASVLLVTVERGTVAVGPLERGTPTASLTWRARRRLAHADVGAASKLLRAGSGRDVDNPLAVAAAVVEVLRSDRPEAWTVHPEGTTRHANEGAFDPRLRWRGPDLQELPPLTSPASSASELAVAREVREQAQRWLVGKGADRITHSGGTFLAHLVGTAEILMTWRQPDPIVRAGLLHSIYSTQFFGRVLVEIEHRAEVAERVGVLAERLAFLFCTVDRRSLWRHADEGAELGGKGWPVTNRYTGQTEQLPPRLLAALLCIEGANLDEQRRGRDRDAAPASRCAVLLRIASPRLDVAVTPGARYA